MTVTASGIDATGRSLLVAVMATSGTATAVLAFEVPLSSLGGAVAGPPGSDGTPGSATTAPDHRRVQTLNETNTPEKIMREDIHGPLC